METPLRQGSEGLEGEGRWAARPVLSALLRIAIFTVPIAAALAATWLARTLLPTPADRIGWLGWWVTLLGLSTIVAIGLERFGRRFFPLAMLLKLSMLFPKEAPSRFRVARRSGSVRQLRTMLDAPTTDVDTAENAGKILSLVMALSNHDRKTRGHSERVQVFTDLLSQELDLSQAERYRLRWAALLHDIGKLTVDPSLLNKPAALEPQEWDKIKQHPLDGAKLAAPLLSWLGPWGDAIAQHHERFDGAGYPAGLARGEIAWAGRIVAVADAYDTMTSARSYQTPRSTAAARKELVACAGAQFDPDVVRAFLEISLPKLLSAVGPVSLVVHLPFLARLQDIGQASLTTAAQTAGATAVAGVTAVTLLTPVASAATPPGASAGRSTRQPASTLRADLPRPTPAPSRTPHPHESSEGNDPGHGPSSGGSTSGGGPVDGSGSEGSGNSGGSGNGGGDGGSNSGGSGNSGPGSGGPVVVPPVVPDLIGTLRAEIVAAGLDQNTTDDLTSRLDDIIGKLDDGKIQDACGGLNAFVDRLRGDSGGHAATIDAISVALWTTEAQKIGSALDC